MHANDLVAQLRNVLDRDAALALFQGAVRQESITGHERNVVAYLAERMRALGLDSVVSAEFLPGRPNVWGERNGAGRGPRLLFIGHTDTVHVDGWREHWAGTEREDPFAATVVDGAVWGRGAGDLKAGISASLAALALLDRAGVTLAGDVAFAFVGDEESGEPGTGVSAGIKDYVERLERGDIARPDFVVYVEPTRLAVYPAQIGFFIADVEFTGMSAYFGVPELGHDALKAAHQAMAALWRHSDEVAQRAAHDLVGRGFLLITGLTAGGYIAVPAEARFSLIRKLLPGRIPGRGSRRPRSRRARRRVGPRDRHRVFLPRRARPCARRHRGRDRPRPARGCDALRRHGGGDGRTRPPRGGAVLVRIAFFVNRLGIAAVYCAPGDIRNCHTHQEHVELDEYFAGVVGFAAFMARFCGTVE